jgi:uncharacterized protein with von Willebrand factor type A (vWA) domain
MALLDDLIHFSRLLRERGLKVTPDRVAGAARCVTWIDLARREDFAAALRTNFVSSRKDLAVFEEIFAAFWNRRRLPMPESPKKGEGSEDDSGEEKESAVFSSQELGPSAEQGDDKDRKPKGEYSPHEVLMAKDFSQYREEDWAAVERELIALLSRLTVRISRRREPSVRGREVDFRRSFRKSLPYGGEILNLMRRRRKVKPLRVIVICDVSGSMDVATRFILQFLFGLQRAFRRSEFFVFSTRLTRVTDIMKRNRWAEGLAAISRRVRDWSGGTQIGLCLRRFNDRFAGDLTAESAVVILISDGWDRGDAELLDREMARLKRRARRLIWMNPLLGTPDYQPLCQGMRTALPYIDHFLSAGTLLGFQTLGDVLAGLSRRRR